MRYILLLFFLLGFNSNAQDKAQLGLMFDVTRSTLRLPNGEIYINTGGSGGISEGSDATGYDTNFAIGIYATTPLNYTQNFGLEIFYDQTTSPKYNNLNFSVLNIVPFIDYDPFEINFYMNIGVGMGIPLNNPQFSNTLTETKIDFFGKVSIAYEFEGIARFEFGGYPGVREIVEDTFIRSKYYFGVKLPISCYFD